MSTNLPRELNTFHVKLISVASLRFGSPDNIERVVFDVSPTFNEQRAVDYATVAPVHMPGGIQVYKKTNSRTFNIGATFVSRNSEDATQNMEYLQRLRSWTLPYFGRGSNTGNLEQQAYDLKQVNGLTDKTTQDSVTNTNSQPLDKILARMRTNINLLGAPPDVLYLYAYSRPAGVANPPRENSHYNINRVPVVLTSLDINYPDEVDYIPTNYTTREPMPARMQVTISLIETHSPSEYEEFSLADFKSGKLVNF
jgi:hypothetical protein